MKKLITILVILTAITGSLQAQDTITTDSGLKIIIQEEGEGWKPAKGSKVWVNYTGYFAKNNKEFETSDGYPIKFILGDGEVIPGWDEGFGYLKKGGKARLIISSELGYGAKGSKDLDGKYVIPPNTDLIFDVELVKFK